MPSCFFACGLVRASTKIQSAYCAIVVQVFWPEITQESPSAPGARAQAREVRSGAGLGKALAPPVAQVDDARQEPLLLRLRAEGVDDRPDHADAEGDRLRRVAALDLVEEDRLLDRAPARAAPFLRPVRDRPALVGEDARPADVVVLGEMSPGDALLADRGRQVVAHEGAHFGAKRDFVVGQSKVHGVASRAAQPRQGRRPAQIGAQCRASERRRQLGGQQGPSPGSLSRPQRPSASRPGLC